MAFHPKCTLPGEKVVYVAAPDVRSTLDILWPSLATIIVCTYQVLHLNVPEQRLGRDKGFTGDLKWTFRRLGNSLKWSCVNLLAPELVLCKAISDWFGARHQLRALHQALPATKKTWTMAHMLFADMGGFVIGYTPKNEDNHDRRDVSTSNDPEMEHTDLESRANGEVVDTSDKPAVLTDCSATKVWHFRAGTLRTAIERGYLPQDLVTKDEIMDKSKADAFTKVLAMGQICYYVVAVITRATRGLPVSPIELGVTAFVGCSMTTYILSFSKPKGVTEAIKIGVFEQGIPEWLISRDHARYGLFSLSNPILGEPPSNLELPSRGEESVNPESLALTPICLLFGAVHLAGWNLEFPTTAIDIWLWRAAAVTSTVMYPCTFVVCTLFYNVLLLCLPKDSAERGSGLLGIFGGVLYALARLIIIGEMFRGLIFLPPGAFVATWTTNIPHIG